MSPQEITKIKFQIWSIKEARKQLSWYHNHDDDPTGQFNTVKEKRAYLTSERKRLMALLK